MPTLIERSGAANIWQLAGEYYVYQGVRLVRVCPSIGMAREVAAGCVR